MRSPKNRSDWTINDLDAYNITFVSQDTAIFFDQKPLSLLPQNSDLLNNLTADEMVDEENYQVVRYLAMDLQ